MPTSDLQGPARRTASLAAIALLLGLIVAGRSVIDRIAAAEFKPALPGLPMD